MWCDPGRFLAPGRPRILALAALAAVAALVAGPAGCGFQPLYAPASPGESAPVDHLAAVRINPLPNRDGQQLHNLLRDQLNPGGQPARPAYILDVRLTLDTEEVGIRKDQTATRANLFLNSWFTLRAAADNRVLYEDRVSSINSYNILDQPYPTDVAEADALSRGLRELSDDIKLRLAVFFASEAAQDL